MASRRYRFDASGQEQPIWASKRKLQEMGREWGRQAFSNGQPAPINYGNTTHDTAAKEEFDRLTKLAESLRK